MLFKDLSKKSWAENSLNIIRLYFLSLLRNPVIYKHNYIASRKHNLFEYTLFSKLILKSSNSYLGPSTPIFFILSPGVNPLKDVEALGKKLGYTAILKNFHNVSLGQGQEVVAEAAMATAAKGN